MHACKSPCLVPSVLLTWFRNVNWFNEPWNTLRQFTDPYLNIFRWAQAVATRTLVCQPTCLEGGSSLWRGGARAVCIAHACGPSPWGMQLAHPARLASSGLTTPVAYAIVQPRPAPPPLPRTCQPQAQACMHSGCTSVFETCPPAHACIHARMLARLPAWACTAGVSSLPWAAWI